MILELTPEQQAFQRDVETFAAAVVEPAAARIDESGRLSLGPPEAGRRARPDGHDDRRRRGAAAGRDYLSYALAIEAVSRASATLGVILVVNNSLVGDVLARFGSDWQKDRWLRALATGQATGAFALSEENAGTDAANVEMTAAVVDDGQGVQPDRAARSGWPAPRARTSSLVFAATRPGMRAHGITAFLVPMSTPGIERTARADSLGVRGLGCMDLSFMDVRVPADHVVGAVNEGFKLAMWALEGGRVAIAAQALGIGQAALDEALRHAKTRHTFGKPIAEYRGHPVHAGGHGDRTGRGADADLQGRRAEGPPGEHRERGRAGEAGGVGGRASRPPTRRCRSSRRRATGGGRRSSGCSATRARRRSTRARRKPSAWSSPTTSWDSPTHLGAGFAGVLVGC